MTHTATYHTFAVRAGLVPRAPLRIHVGSSRRLYVTPEIARILDGPNHLRRFSRQAAERKIGEFLLGWQISISRRNRRWKWNDAPDLVRLEGHDEIWELCFRDPRPGYRLFGRFIETGVFIGLELHDRETVNHENVSASIISRWNEVFPGLDPIRSDDLGEYVGGVWRDIDGEDR